jgi:hypothetical protein
VVKRRHASKKAEIEEAQLKEFEAFMKEYGDGEMERESERARGREERDKSIKEKVLGRGRRTEGRK